MSGFLRGSPSIVPAIICISVSLGRSSVAGGCFSFPPCLPAFSHSGRQSPTLSIRTSRPPSAERANALPLRLSRDFGASYSGAPLLARRFPRSSLRRAPSLYLSPGFALPAVALAPPRNHRKPAVRADFRRSGIRSGAQKNIRHDLTRMFSGCSPPVGSSVRLRRFVFYRSRVLSTMSPFRFDCECHVDRRRIV